jgi:hypothetical protein
MLGVRKFFREPYNSTVNEQNLKHNNADGVILLIF